MAGGKGQNPNSCPGELPGLASLSLTPYLLEAFLSSTNFIGPSGMFSELRKKLPESQGPEGRFKTLLCCVLLRLPAAGMAGTSALLLLYDLAVQLQPESGP